MAHLVIVRRSESQRLVHLQDVLSGQLTEIVWDRRVTERRRRVIAVDVERRRGDRRRFLPLSWTALGFVLVRGSR